MMKESNAVRIGRYLAGETGSEEREAFEKELESDPALKEEFLSFQRIWEGIPSESVGQWDSALAWQKFRNSTQPHITDTARTRRINIKWPIAAAIIIALGTYFLLFNQGRPVSYVYDALKTDPVQLSDGSKIYLNKGAVVEVYPFRNKKRHVILSGEAFFEVSPDPKRPFTVESGGTITQVVGTAFNITQTTDQTRIFVQQGKVIFKATSNEDAAVALTAGEAARFKGNRMELIPNPSPNLNAWHTRQLNFPKDMSLEEILADASAYFNQKISLENESLKGCRIGSPLSYHNPEINAVLNPLASFVNAKLKIEGNQCTLLGGHCP